jgi:hypothetical protein
MRKVGKKRLAHPTYKVQVMPVCRKVGKKRLAHPTYKVHVMPVCSII